MSTYETILKRRSIRQFSNKKIPKEIINKIVDVGRLAPSGMNLQPVRFLVVTMGSIRENVFEQLKWAGFLNWSPPKEKQPKAYVFMLADSEVRKAGYEYEAGMAGENIMIAAEGLGLASCPLGIPDKKEMRRILDLPERYRLTFVVALGYPVEKSEIEQEKDSLKYWKDKKGKMHVPKRKRREVVFFNRIKT